MLGILLGLSWLLVFAPRLAHAQDDAVELEEAFPSLRFEFPVDLANDGLGRLYVVERAGRIYGFPNDPSTENASLFLDIRDNVFDEDIESGMLSLSFHPDYEENGYFYVYYLAENPLRSVLARFTRAVSNPEAADPESELVILEIPQPSPKHNGGDTFFDSDGYLYLALGDGSTGGDQFGNAQRLTTLLGSILRLDVDRPAEGATYGIPPDNPYAGNSEGYREEIYAHGFRNPWRISFDPETGHIWAADVGERDWEEVDFIVKGGNYGWPMTEGPACFNPPEDCSTEGLYGPVHAYDHDIGVAVTGGFVYRGDRVPALRGKYVFADWSRKLLWSLSYGGANPYESYSEPVVELLADSVRFISSFGVDEAGELYMLRTFENRIMRFKSAGGLGTEPPVAARFELRINGPNPFRTETGFSLEVRETSTVRVAVYDVLGREVDVLFYGTLPSGAQQALRFGGSGLSGGVYFVRAESRSRVVTRKITLAR